MNRSTAVRSQEAPASTTEGGVFEGMFVRALQPTGTFAEELRAAGYDMKRPLPRYPTQVWHACLEVARRHVFPTLAEPDAYHWLGTRFIDGFFDTIMGKVVAVGLPLLGPDGSLQRLPRYWSSAQKPLLVTTAKEGERHWRAELQGPYVLPEFCAGILQGAARRTGVPQATVKVRTRTSEGCVLEIRW